MPSMYLTCFPLTLYARKLRTRLGPQHALHILMSLFTLAGTHFPAKVQQELDLSPLFPRYPPERCAEVRTTLTPCSGTLRVTVLLILSLYGIYVGIVFCTKSTYWAQEKGRPNADVFCFREWWGWREMSAAWHLNILGPPRFLKPSSTQHVQWGKGEPRPLRISGPSPRENGRLQTHLDNWLATHSTRKDNYRIILLVSAYE